MFNNRDPIVLKDDSGQELKDRYPGATLAAKSKCLYPYQGNNNLLLPNPYGIWSDGTTLWVSDFGEDKIYAYTITWADSPIDSSKICKTRTRDSAKDFDTLFTAEPCG